MDIVVTIPKSEYANDDAETKALLENGGCQFWTLGRVPGKLKIGDRVHFVKHGRVESSMSVFDIKENIEQYCDVTGRCWTGRCVLFLRDLQYHDKIKECKGFQGFRYKWWKEEV